MFEVSWESKLHKKDLSQAKEEYKAEKTACLLTPAIFYSANEHEP